MIVLSGQNIEKSFGIETVLNNISLHIDEGERVGLIGNNGSGKTTLMRILAGELTPDGGSVRRGKELRLGYLEQHADFSEDVTLWEAALEVFSETIALEKKIQQLTIAIAESPDASDGLLLEYQQAMDRFEAMEGYQYESKIRGVLRGLGFTDANFDQRVSTFSGGQKSRVLLARLLLAEPHILLLDEPTNHLDLDAVRWLESFLQEYKGTVLVISHDRYFLDAITTRIAFLQEKMTTYDGNYTVFMDKYKKAMEIQAAAYENQAKEIERQKEIIQRFEAYGNKKFIQARSRKRMLEKMEVLDKPQGETQQMKLRITPARDSGKDVLAVDALSMAFGDKTLFENIDLFVERGERIGMIGPNGIGKTTLFKILQGKLQPTHGKFRFGTGVQFGFLEQEQQDLSNDKTVLDEVWDADPKRTVGEIRNILASFLFYGDDIFKEIENLSGGERARVQLCKLMLSGANTLFLDEPTNHLDIESKEALESACLAFTGTLLFISHDRYFLNRIANRILHLHEDGLDSYLGNYDYYLEKSKPEEEFVEEVQNKTAEKKERKKEKENKKRQREIQAQKRNLEKDIQALENRIQEIDQILNDSEIYNHPDQVQTHVKERQSIENQLEEMYLIWMDLAEDS